MRIINLYQLWDITARTTAGPIMAFRHDAAAIRAFQDTLNADGILPNKYPEQFNLIRIGAQDEDTAMLILQNKEGEYEAEVTVVATGREYKELKEKNNAQ